MVFLNRNAISDSTNFVYYGLFLPVQVLLHSNSIFNGSPGIWQYLELIQPVQIKTYYGTYMLQYDCFCVFFRADTVPIFSFSNGC
jgi:hypothetical protein